MDAPERNAHRQHAAFPMQAVAVLADEVLEDATVLQLDKSHVGGRRNGLQRIGRLDVAIPSLGTQCPHAVGAAKIGDALQLVSVSLVSSTRRCLLPCPLSFSPKEKWETHRPRSTHRRQ